MERGDIPPPPPPPPPTHTQEMQLHFSKLLNFHSGVHETLHTCIHTHTHTHHHVHVHGSVTCQLQIPAYKCNRFKLCFHYKHFQFVQNHYSMVHQYSCTHTCTDVRYIHVCVHSTSNGFRNTCMYYNNY